MKRTEENIQQNKSSFILYLDQLEIIDDLTMEQRGLLLTAIRNYIFTGESVELEPIVKVAFTPIKNSLHRDLVKWRNQVQANKVNGLLGGRPKKANESKRKQTVTQNNHNGFSDNPINPDSVSVSVSVNESVNESVNDKKISGADSPLDDALGKFIENRKVLKKPMTKNAIVLLKNKLYEISNSDEERIRILEQSILNGWQGIFPLKQDFKQNETPSWMKKLDAQKGVTIDAEYETK